MRASELYFLVHLGLVLAFASRLLKAKKSPSSTLAWLVIASLFPWLGIGMYLLMGKRKLPTLIPYKSFEPRGLEAGEILGDGEKAYAEFVRLIKEAKQSIYLETFIFGRDEVAVSILDLLTEKAAEGLEVRILLDGIGPMLSGRPHFKSFKKAGGKFALFWATHWWRGGLNLRNHRKMLIVDQSVAITGGMNLAAEYLGPKKDKRRWVDLAFKVSGPVVKDCLHLFSNDWQIATGEIINKLPLVNESFSGVNLLACGPQYREDVIYDWLIEKIFNAQKSILVATPYFVPDETLIKALELARSRGVQVHLLVPEKSNHRLADYSRDAHVENLQRQGVVFHLFPHMLHAKLIIIDDLSGLIGSANFDCRSLLINFEAGLVVTDGKHVKAMKDWFHHHCLMAKTPQMKNNFVKIWRNELAKILSPIL